MKNKGILNIVRKPEINGRHTYRQPEQPKDKSILKDPILFDDRPPKPLTNNGQPQNQKLVIVKQQNPKGKMKSQSYVSSEESRSDDAQEYRITDQEEKKQQRNVRNSASDEEYETNNSDFTQQQNEQINNNEEYEEEDQQEEDEFDEEGEYDENPQENEEDEYQEEPEEYADDDQPEEGEDDQLEEGEDDQPEEGEDDSQDYDDYEEDEYFEQQSADEEDQEEKQEESEQKVKGKPQISDAAFRMISFNLRRNNPELPRDVAQRTQRDVDGKRIEITQRNSEQVNKPIQENKQVNQPIFEKKVPIEFKSSNPVAELRERLLAKRQNNNQEPKQLKYDCETEWSNFLFTDNMCTPANLADANNLRLYDSTFEVDDQFQLDTSLIVKPYVRSNQGKEETILRSDKGMVKSLQRLHRIFSERDKRKDDGKFVSIIDIFQYLSDRFRALNTELKQIESKNSNIYIFRIQYLEQLIRVYLLSYIEMMRADQTIDEIKQNIKNCKQYLIEALDTLITDYSTLFHELNEARHYLLDNLPEYIQYYYLMLTLSILSTDSIQKISNLDFVIYSQFEYSQLLMRTPEYLFCKTIQECMILRNFNKIIEFGKDIQITIFQQFFIYLLQEKVQQVVGSQKYSAGLTGSKIQFDWINLEEIYERMLQITNMVAVINNRGKFSLYISGKEQIKVSIQPTPQPPNNLKNILVEIGKKLMIQKISNFLAPHFQSVEIQLGNFYRMLRIMNHWKLYMYKRKRVRKFKQSSQVKIKNLQLNQQQSFRSQLAAKLLAHSQSQKLYYKIVIIDNYSHSSIVQKVVYSICERTISNEDSLILECSINFKQKEYQLLLSIQIIKQQQEERMCGTDLFIIIGEGQVNKCCLQIVFDSQIEHDQNLTVNYKYLELYDFYFDSYEYNQKLMQTVDNSLRNKIAFGDLELYSLPNFFQDVLSIQLEKYDNNCIEYFISKCVLTEICLENVLKNNHNSEELPQELLFDKYINQESILKYATKFNPGNNLMIPLCTKIKTYISESDFVNDVKYYLDDQMNTGALLNLLRNHFSFGMTCKGDWHQLFEFIVCQLIEYLKETDIYFVVPKNYKIIIDEQQLYVRIQKDIKQLTNNSSSSAMNKFLKQDLRDWVSKKICK